MSGTLVVRSLGNLTCALDAAQRDAHLRFACRLRQLFDRLAIAIAAAEIHQAVHSGRVALEHLFDEAHALEELAPVERLHQTQAANQVRDRRLLRGLVLPFRADHVLDRLTSRRQCYIEVLSQ